MSFFVRVECKGCGKMDFALILLVVAGVWIVLRGRYQRSHIALLASHLSELNLERHMETLTQGYARAIGEESESRQLQVLETYHQTENAVASQVRRLAESMQREDRQATSMCASKICIPYAERFLPAITRNFVDLLNIHAAGLQRVVANEEGLALKDRAFHLSAELYLFQHSCHWYCKSRTVADARLLLRHQVDHQKVLDSVTSKTRDAYLQWLRGHPA